MTLRPLTPADTDAVVALATRAFDSQTEGDHIRSMLGAYFRSGLAGVILRKQLDETLPREYFAYVRREGQVERIVGMTGLYRLGTWTWPGNLWLGWTAIDTDFQGQGLGSAMLEFVMDLARNRGAEWLKVETEAGGRAVGFYLRNGFVEECRLARHYGANIDAVVLSRRLTE